MKGGGEGEAFDQCGPHSKLGGGQQVARLSKHRTDDNAPEERPNAPDAGSHALMRQDPKTYSSINPEVGTLPPPLACLLAR